MTILELAGLQLRNDGNRDIAKRELALDINHLRIEDGDTIFVLGLRGAGKSALQKALHSIYQSNLYDGENLQLPQHALEKPPIQLTRLQRTAGIRFHEQSGDPESIPAVTEKVLIYCDDPLLPNTVIPSGREIIKRAKELRHTLLLAADIDRLNVTLRYFREYGGKRILWIHCGLVVFDGSTEAFLTERNMLQRSLGLWEHTNDPMVQYFLSATTFFG